MADTMPRRFLGLSRFGNFLFCRRRLLNRFLRNRFLGEGHFSDAHSTFDRRRSPDRHGCLLRSHVEEQSPSHPEVHAPQVRKNTNQTIAKVNTAAIVLTTSTAATEGPGSAERASVGVSTI